MGEAIYYAKWKYTNKMLAKTALTKISSFLQETQEAYDFWQENRGNTPDEFWPKFKNKFPKCYNFLASFHLAGGDCNNALAGTMSVGHEDCYIDELEVRYSAEVWHFAEWSPFVQWLAIDTGAESYGYVSDEDANLFDCIEMTGNEGWVKTS